MIFAQQEQMMTTQELTMILLIMGGFVVFSVTAVFLTFKKFGRKATQNEKDKAIRMEESGERPPIDR